MKICERVATERKQLKKLQMAYAEHLAEDRRDRLKWMERAIDMQQETVDKLREARNAVLPFGCLGCKQRAECTISQDMQWQ